MKETLKRSIGAWKADHCFKTFASAAISAAISLAFTLYNGFLGIYYHSLWNTAICIYYILLLVVRMIVINAQLKNVRDLTNTNIQIKRAYFLSHIILLGINISLIIPITIMINGGRTYSFGMIPAIAMAAYTTYRITMAVINFKKSRKTNNPLVRELRSIGLVDTLVSVLLLQNTLIIVNDGKMTDSMTILSIVSSTAVWLLIAAISILSFARIKDICTKQQ